MSSQCFLIDDMATILHEHKRMGIHHRLIGYAQKGVAVKEALLDRGRYDVFLMTLFLPVLHSGPCSNL